MWLKVRKRKLYFENNGECVNELLNVDVKTDIRDVDDHVGGRKFYFCSK